MSSPEEEVQTLRIHSYGFCWTPPLLCDEVATGKSRESESTFDGQGLLVSWFVPKEWIMELAVAIERPAPVAHGATAQWSALYAKARGLTPMSIRLMGRSISPEPGNPQSTQKPAQLQISVTCAGVFSIQGQMKRDVVRQSTHGSRSIPHDIPCNLAQRFPLYRAKPCPHLFVLIYHYLIVPQPLMYFIEGCLNQMGPPFAPHRPNRPTGPATNSLAPNCPINVSTSVCA